MQLCHSSLDQWLKDNQDPVSRKLSSVKVWFKQIVSAVAYIHSKKLLHRDLKPSNILISEDGRLKNSYVPRYSSKTDVFTLGLILVEMCCLMTRDERTLVFNCYRAGAKNDVDLDPSTAEFISWMTQVDPNCRPSCSEMLNSEFLMGTHSPMCCH